MIKWVEVKKGDKIVFNSGNGRGSIVKVKNKGYHFMPAKIGMRLNGEKSPIGKLEMFILTDIKWFKFEDEYITNCYVTRCKDNTSFLISDRNLQRYFSKTQLSSLGGI